MTNFSHKRYATDRIISIEAEKRQIRPDVDTATTCKPKALNNILCTRRMDYLATCVADVEVYMCEMMSSSYSAAMSNQHIKQSNARKNGKNINSATDFAIMISI